MSHVDQDISDLIGPLEPYLPPKKANESSETKKRHPVHMTVTYAQSLDGRISAGRGLRTKLSGPGSMSLTHYLRSRHEAILVGLGTMIADDPRLSCRFPGAGSSPRPIILDSHLNWPVDEKHWKILELAKEGTGRAPWVLTTEEAKTHPAFNARKALVTASGGRVIELHSLKWPSILEFLAKEGLHSLMVEGGANVIDTALSSGLSSSVIVTIAPLYLGQKGVEASPSGPLNLEQIQWLKVGDDTVLCGRQS